MSQEKVGWWCRVSERVGILYQSRNKPTINVVELLTKSQKGVRFVGFMEPKTPIIDDVYWETFNKLRSKTNQHRYCPHTIAKTKENIQGSYEYF